MVAGAGCVDQGEAGNNWELGTERRKQAPCKLVDMVRDFEVGEDQGDLWSAEIDSEAVVAFVELVAGDEASRRNSHIQPGE